MNKVPPNAEQPADIDQIYRRLSGQDPGRPGEWVRRKVQAYAAQQAAERAVRSTAKTQDGLSTTGTMSALRPAAAPTAAVAESVEQPASKSWLLPGIAGAVVVVAAVGFFVVPKLMGGSAESSTAAPVAATQPEVSHAPIEEPPPPPSPQETESDSTEAPSSAQTSLGTGDAASSQPATMPSNTASPVASAISTPPATTPADSQATTLPAHSQPAATPVTGRAGAPTAPPPPAAGSPTKPSAGSHQSVAAQTQAPIPPPAMRSARAAKQPPGTQTNTSGSDQAGSAVPTAHATPAAHTTPAAHDMPAGTTATPKAATPTDASGATPAAAATGTSVPSAVSAAPTQAAPPPAQQASAAGPATSAPAATAAAAPVAAAAPAAGSASDEFWVAAKSGDMAGLQAAFDNHVDVNSVSSTGETALILAIQHTHLDAVRALLAHGANPNTPDSRGLTPMRAARVRNNYPILQALQHAGK